MGKNSNSNSNNKYEQARQQLNSSRTTIRVQKTTPHTNTSLNVRRSNQPKIDAQIQADKSNNDYDKISQASAKILQSQFDEYFKKTFNEYKEYNLPMRKQH